MCGRLCASPRTRRRSEHLYRLAYLNLGHNQLTSVANINLVLGNVTVLVLRNNQVGVGGGGGGGGAHRPARTKPAKIV